VLIVVAVVSALIPGVLWWRERGRRRSMERSIEIQAEALAIGEETARAKDAALSELCQRLEALRRQAEAAEAEEAASRSELVALPPDEAWEHTFGRGGAP
jgi:hypothetical protein